MVGTLVLFKRRNKLRVGRKRIRDGLYRLVVERQLLPPAGALAVRLRGRTARSARQYQAPDSGSAPRLPGRAAR